jgi:hypothetical protein
VRVYEISDSPDVFRFDQAWADADLPAHANGQSQHEREQGQMIIRLLVYLLIFNMIINWIMYGHFFFRWY